MLMRWIRRYPTMAVVVTTVLALAAGVVVGDARRDEPELRLPDAGPAVAAARPAGAPPEDAPAETGDGELTGGTGPWTEASLAVVGGGLDVDHAAVLARVFDPETGVGGDAPGPIVQPAGAPLPPADDADGDAADAPATTDDAADTTADDRAPTADALTADGDAEVDAEELEAGGLTGFLGLDWFTRFVDVCADAPEEEGCPTGIGGSILLPISDDERTLPPIDVAPHTYAHLDPDEVRCPQGLRSDGRVDVLLSTNVPARSLRIEQVARDRVLQRWDLATSDAERRIFDRYWLEGGVPRVIPGVKHCFTVDDWDRTDSHLRVRAEDDAGNVVEKAVSLEILNVRRSGSATRGGRPPVTFTPDGERLRVGVPIDGDAEQAWVVTLHRVGPRATEDTCTSIEGDVLDRRYRGNVDTINGRWETIPPGDHEARYDRLEQWFVYPGEGAVADICVWITRPPTRSYDRPVVQLRETRRIQAPRHYRTTIQVTEVVLDDGAEADSIVVELPHWVGAPSISLPDTDLPAGYFPTARTLPALESGAAPHPADTFVKITGPSGTVAWRRVPTPLACDGPCDGMRTFQVPIPGRSFVDEICGGWSCGDRPADFTDGLLTLAVTTAPGPSGPPSGATPTEWSVGPATAFGSAGPADPGPVPRLDWNGARATAVTVDGELAVSLVLPFDREVVLTDVIADIDPSSVCAPAPQTSERPARTHVVSVRGVCAGQWYTFGFLATAADGGTLDLRPWIDGRATGRSGLIPVATPAHFVRALSYEVTYEKSRRLVTDSIHLELGGRHIPLQPAYDGPWECHGDNDLPARRTGVIGSAGAGRPAVALSDPVGVGLRIRVHECGGESFTLDLAAAPRLADLLAGPITLRGESDAGTAEVTLTITP